MSDEYLSKEEIKKWRSSVEKITLEEYAARLGKKLQEEKQTNDLADMLYTHFNPRQSFDTYNTVTKLEKIDLSPKPHNSKQKSSKIKFDDLDNDDIDNDNLDLDTSLDFEEQSLLKKIKAEKEPTKKQASAKKSSKQAAETEEAAEEPKTKRSKKAKAEDTSDKPDTTKKSSKNETKKAEGNTKKSAAKQTADKKKSTKGKADSKSKNTSKLDFSSLNITFIKPLTDREEKVLAYFMDNRGQIVYAKDLADLLELKRDYIYKYIKNLRGKMSTDIIINADNGGFKLD